MASWVKRLIAIVVSVAVLAGLGEIALRLIIPNAIAGAVRSQLKLTPDHPVDVSLGGSALLYAVTGRVGDVTVDVPDTPLIEGLTADASLHAASVPFNPTSGEIREGSVALTLSPEQLGAVISTLTSGVADTGEVRDGSLVVGRTMEFFGQQVPLTATLQLAVVGDGDVEVTPEGLSAAGLDLSTEMIAQAGGSVLEPLLQPRTVCVRDQLPKGLKLTGISFSSTGSATIEADLAPGILSDPAQRDTGSCEAG